MQNKISIFNKIKKVVTLTFSNKKYTRHACIKNLNRVNDFSNQIKSSKLKSLQDMKNYKI